MHGKAARGTLSAIVLFPGMRERCIRLGNHLPSFYSQFIFGTVATHQHRFQLYLCPSSPSATDQSSVARPGELRFQYATLICRLQIERRYVTLLLSLLFFLFFFSFFLFDLNAIPIASGLTLQHSHRPAAQAQILPGAGSVSVYTLQYHSFRSLRMLRFSNWYKTVEAYKATQLSKVP